MNLDLTSATQPWMAHHTAKRIFCDMAGREIDPTSIEAIALRLTLLRQALAGDNQADFCRRYEFEPRLWNNYERGVSRISIDNARKLWRKIGVGIEWTYNGIDVLLPALIAEKLRAAETAASPRTRKRA